MQSSTNDRGQRFKRRRDCRCRGLYSRFSRVAMKCRGSSPTVREGVIVRVRGSSPTVREGVIVRVSGRMKIAHRFIGGIDDVIFDIKPALAGDRFGVR